MKERLKCIGMDCYYNPDVGDDILSGWNTIIDIIKDLKHANEEISSHSPEHLYHMNHVNLMEIYMNELIAPSDYSQSSERLLKMYIIPFICHGHDILKERNVINYKGDEFAIPSSLDDYIDDNTDILQSLGLHQYAKKLSAHTVAAAIWLYDRYKDKFTTQVFKHEKLTIFEASHIRYSHEQLFNTMCIIVAFHSSPVKEIYLEYDSEIRELIDIVVLCDKLSSNHLKINMLGKKVRADLDAMIFDESFESWESCSPVKKDSALLAAKLIGAGKHPSGIESRMITLYAGRLRTHSIFISKGIDIKTLGEKRKWPKRLNQRLIQNSKYSKMFSLVEDTKDTPPRMV